MIEAQLLLSTQPWVFGVPRCAPVSRRGTTDQHGNVIALWKHHFENPFLVFICWHAMTCRQISSPCDLGRCCSILTFPLGVRLGLVMGTYIHVCVSFLTHDTITQRNWNITPKFLSPSRRRVAALEQWAHHLLLKFCRNFLTSSVHMHMGRMLKYIHIYIASRLIWGIHIYIHCKYIYICILEIYLHSYKYIVFTKLGIYKPSGKWHRLSLKGFPRPEHLNRHLDAALVLRQTIAISKKNRTKNKLTRLFMEFHRWKLPYNPYIFSQKYGISKSSWEAHVNSHGWSHQGGGRIAILERNGSLTQEDM